MTQRGEGGDPAPASEEDGVVRAHPEGTVVRLRVVAGARRTELVRGRSPRQVRAALLDP